MSSSKVAVVTGSNRGIGFAVIEGLLKSNEYQGDVVICCRNIDQGREAARKLELKYSNRHGKKIHIQQVSITDSDTIASLKEFLLKEYGGLDILVNNAAVVYVDESVAPLTSLATEVINTNYYGTAQVCDRLWSLLRPGARIVNVSSVNGMLNWIENEEIKRKLTCCDLSRKDLDCLVEEYLEDVKDGKHKEKGWPTGMMSVTKASKVFVTALTNILSRNVDTSQDIIINCAHPGFVRTDASGGRGFLDPHEGATSILKGCLVPPGEEPRGKFIWNDCSIVPWDMDREKIQAILDSYPE